MQYFKKLALIASLVGASYYCHAEVIFDSKLEDQPTIKVATFNMMASRMTSTDDIVDAVKNIDADIIGIQEVDKNTKRSTKNFRKGNSKTINQAAYIAKKTGMNFIYCKTIDFDGGEYGTALMSKYPIKEYKELPLPNLKGEEARKACAAFIEMPNLPAPVLGVVTHLTTATDSLKMKQATAINENFTPAQVKNAMPIVMLDMNGTPESAHTKRLLELFSPVDESFTKTAPSWNPDRKLDYVLTSKAQKWQVVDLRVPSSKELVNENVNWGSVSDHLPVIATLKLIEQ